MCDCQKCDTHQGSSAPRNTADFLGFCDPVKTEISSQTQREAMITISLRSLLLQQPLSYRGPSGLGWG